MKKLTHDPDEKEIVASYERDEWRPLKDPKTEMARLKQYARNTLQKNKRINIRLAERDLVNIQARAIEEGMPYQTLISSILHKYLSGRLVERHTA